MTDSLAALFAAFERRDLFDDDKFSFFGVSIDPQDETERRVVDRYPGYRIFWDFDGKVSSLYGAAPIDWNARGDHTTVRRMYVVLDPTLRVLKVFSSANGNDDVHAVFSYLEQLPPVERFSGLHMQAPIIVLPNVFEPQLCKRLIGLYEENGGSDTGFMREVNGKTVEVQDPGHKRRKDYVIVDDELIAEIRSKFVRRIAPEILKVHQFKISRMERYIVACYAAEDKAHFRPHRDNTTSGTAHRRFAVSVNLNEDFKGGEVGFPEYGRQTFKAPAGGDMPFCRFYTMTPQRRSGKPTASLSHQVWGLPVDFH